MPHILYFIVAVLVTAYVKPASCVVTPSVSIKEENPPENSPRIERNPIGITNIIALVGQPLSLECIPRDVTNQAKIIWKWQDANNPKNFFHINTDMRSNDISKYKITKGTSAKNAIRLELPTVSPQSAGFLICQVLYQEDLFVQAKRLIKVYAYPRIVQYKSSFEISVLAGKNATLRCNATGIPKPSLTWRRIGGSSALIRGYGRVTQGEKIVFQRTIPDDRGLYRCQALNLMGTVDWDVLLKVLFKPQVKIFTSAVGKLVQQKLGCRMQLYCTVVANPRPSNANVRWTNSNGQQITASGTRVRTYIMQAADYTTYFIINFVRVQASDFGRYTCSATNEYGTGTDSVEFSASAIALADRSNRILCSARHLSASGFLLLLGILCTLLRP